MDILEAIMNIPWYAVLTGVGVVGILIGMVVGRITKKTPPPSTPLPLPREPSSVQPDLIVEITEFPQEVEGRICGDKVTVVVNGDPYAPAPDGYRRIPGGSLRSSVFERDLGKASLREIRETLENWISVSLAAKVSLPRPLRSDTKVAIGRAKITVN